MAEPQFKTPFQPLSSRLSGPVLISRPASSITGYWSLVTGYWLLAIGP